MAAGAARGGSSGVFWINDLSDEEQPMVFVPGVDEALIGPTHFIQGPGRSTSSSKRGTKTKGSSGRSSGSKNEATVKKSGKKQLPSYGSVVHTNQKLSVHQSTDMLTVCTPAMDPDTFLPPQQVILETNRTKSQICLKDLCSEDKRRIANLIEELARVSEEKEESVQRLKDEQGNFERKIQHLEQHNLLIAEERESLQQQYRECQELLGLYQKYLSQQQEKLNQSIAELSQAQAHNKVLSSDAVQSRKSTSRAKATLFDGSYLGLAAAQARQTQVVRGGDGDSGAAQMPSNANSISSVSELSPNDGSLKMHRGHKKERREPLVESCERLERCQASGRDSGYGTQQRSSDHGSRLVNGHHDTANAHKCERRHCWPVPSSEANGALTRPQLGHEDWEEKRHQLLLQKMQLEVEREKLQARLQEQEERLSRQDHQLQQSRLDYSRFQQAALAELSSSNTGTGDPQLEGPTCQDLPSSAPGDAAVHPVEQNLHDKRSCPAPAREENSMQTLEKLELSRKEVATSPIKSCASLIMPPSFPASYKTPDARLDFSLVELLDIFSPVSVPEHSKVSARRTKITQHSIPTFATPKPLGRSLITPVMTYPQITQQDPEESQILEDIFFIL